MLTVKLEDIKQLYPAGILNINQTELRKVQGSNELISRVRREANGMFTLLDIYPSTTDPDTTDSVPETN